MARSWNPPTPIKYLFKKLSVGHEITTEGGNSLSAPQLVRLACNIIHKTGLFDTAYHYWWGRSMADKIINHLKYSFKKWENNW